MLRVAVVAVVAAAVLTSPSPAAAAVPIPGVPYSPTFSGHPAKARPINGIPPVPQNPFMAPNGNSGIHDDGWQTNTYTRPGPLGDAPMTASNLIGGDCGSIAFDHTGRIVATCVGVNIMVYLIDPATLDVLARYRLPGRNLVGVLQNPNVFQGFGGGGYFYLDDQDRAVVGTTTGHIFVLAEDGAGFALQHDFDLSGALQSGETLNSALPDSNGLLWLVAKRDGVVGTLDMTTGAIHTVRVGHGKTGEIENSFAVGTAGDVYIATSRELYRFEARRGVPTVVWHVAYPNSGIHKPGQVDDGTGTTPAILPGGYVAITDNADPMDVVVYRTRRTVAQRQVCAVPVFEKGASATENSLIAAGHSLVVENNYGYTSPASTLLGGVTKPGFARVDIDRGGAGCHLVWTNSSIAAPTVVPKLSLATGLVYAYTKTGDLRDPWFWTAIDFRTGHTVWRQVSGTGVGYNNNYAGFTLGPNGTAYLGVLGGIISLH